MSAAGFSVGEFSALVFSGALDFEDGKKTLDWSPVFIPMIKNDKDSKKTLDWSPVLKTLVVQTQ